jgi:hypothetical protein
VNRSTSVASASTTSRCKSPTVKSWSAVEHLDDCGVVHSGIIDATWGATLVFRDPDNIQLELFVDPTAEEVAERLAEQR